MLAGIGIDIHEVARMRRELRKEGGGVRDSVFSAAEVARCTASADPAAQYALCFAVKEAVLKALGTGWAHGVGWRDVEVACGGRSAQVLLGGAALAQAQRQGVTKVHASTTCDPRVAMATVVLEA